MIWNEALAACPFFAPARGVATSLYLPGLSLRPARRPVKRKLLAPAPLVRLKLPGRATRRVHLCALRLALVGLTQRPPFALRPGCGWTTVKLTLAATLSV